MDPNLSPNQRDDALASILTKHIADSEVPNEVSQIALKIDFVFAIGTTLFNFH